jgi:tRNA dimethylallyltransferase
MASKNDNQKVIAIVGATASGKSDWAKRLAHKYKGLVISVDSRQIYKGLDIGTAKDKSFHQELIDIVEPADNFSLKNYQDSANELLKKSFLNKQVPFLVGGTGLYLDAIVYGFKLPDLREESLKLRKELEEKTDAELYHLLQQLDPDASEKIDPRNKRRVIRALEVTILTERPFSEQQKKQKPPFKTLIIGIDKPREMLYARADARVEKMIKDGLVEEVRSIIKKYPVDLPSLNTIGYREMIDYLQGRCDLPAAKEKIKFNTHNYIRKQDTWFRRNKQIKWVKTIEEADKLINHFLN